ncbi:GNAT family N-acetyltransferase [Pontibacter harenae]|uniref:GNAT family N-acetyltransferase n=1 Tax=Pontibacter harenae TaxID=2894083 RepID=UPI001E4BBEF7|nr:GNAT family N-acetyltransferase [Pontibacter harenae]MCC9166278.1 GNAT family N-acetyltransferase [Pontibacter harenae]
MSASLQFILIRDVDFEGMPAVQQLYEEAFPIEERRQFHKLLQLIGKPNMFLHAIAAHDNIVSVCVHWQLKELLYLEHLAISPQHQGKGYGSQTIQWLQKQTKERIVLEVERPTDAITRKRIKFYHKLGFTLHQEYPYLQPPYEKTVAPVPMYLMARPAATDVAALASIAELLKQEVYEPFYS